MFGNGNAEEEDPFEEVPVFQYFESEDEGKLAAVMRTGQPD